MNNSNPESKSSAPILSRRRFLTLAAASLAGAVVPNPNLLVSIADQVSTAHAAAPTEATSACSPFERTWSNLGCSEQAGIQLFVDRLTIIKDASGRVISERREPAVKNDYLIENVQKPAQRVVATIKNENNVGVARRIVQTRQPNGSIVGSTDISTFVFNGCHDGTSRIRLFCDGQENFVDAPGIKLNIYRYEGETRPSKFIDQVVSVVRCNPLKQRLTSTIEETIPATPAPTPEKPAPTAAPQATPEKGNQSPVPSGSQAPLSETDPSLEQQYGLVAEMPEGQNILIIDN